MPKNKFLALNLIIIGLYACSFLLKENDFGKIIFALLGVYLIFFPGALLVSRLPINKYFVFPFNLILSISISVFTSLVMAMICSALFGIFSQIGAVAVVVTTSLALTLINYFIKGEPDLKFEKKSLIWLIPIMIPIALLIVCYVIYPYFVGDDTYVLVSSINESIRLQSIVQPFIERRPFFTHFILFIFNSTGLSINSILIFFLPVLAMLSFTLPIAIFAKSKNYLLSILGGLIFLASPYLYFQLQYSIPQIFILIFCFPVLLTSVIGLYKNDKLLVAMSLLLATSAIAFHELAIILILTSLTAVVTMTISGLALKPRQTIKRIIFALIIAAPYLILLKIPQKAKLIAFIPNFFINNLPDKFTWNWWYVSHYVNPDGIVFEYPGLSGVAWYFYLGLLIAIISIFLLAIVGKKINRKELLFGLPLIVFTSIFLFVAEIYPRFAKIAFLPERAWIFLDTGLTLLIVLALYLIIKNRLISKTATTIISVIISLSILSGVAGSIFLTYNRGILLSKKEDKAINFIRSLPSSSTIASTQAYNFNMSSFAGKNFLGVSPMPSNSLQDIFAKTLSQAQDYNASQVELKKVAYVDTSGQETIYEITEIPFETIDLDNIYFVYSKYRFEKTKFVGNPNYYKSNDINNKGLFLENTAKPANGEKVFEQDGVAIYKIKK